MFKKLLVANRGEIALRILRAAQDLGIATVSVYARDDVGAPHTLLADEAVALDATGPAAYLDIATLVATARAHACDAVHPGYGFLSERADFARACAAAGLCFVGPTPDQLALFGDKACARALAAEHGVPLLPGTGAATLAELQAFFAEQRAHDPQCGLMLKAVAGGGGRGMRAVLQPADLPEAYTRCSAEAQAAFGLGAVYAERLMPRARHLEIQLIGDGRQVMALGERECTLQRRFQKLVEIAPSPTLPDALRAQLVQAALTLARASGYQSLGTFEFLVDEASTELPFVFIEANPRLQVEHTVTEAVTGVDLVAAQIAIAAGRSLAALGLDPAAPPMPRGFAVQWRINAERLDAQGQAQAASGLLTRCELAAGPGVRVDSQARQGLQPSPHYDTLLAKLIVHHPGHGAEGWADVLRRSRRALGECRIEGLATNLPLLRALAEHPALAEHAVHTRWLEAEWPALQPLLAAHADAHHASTATQAPTAADDTPPPGLQALRAPMAGRLVQFSVAEGGLLADGAEALVLESMKMQHGIASPLAARVAARRVAEGDFVQDGQVLLWLTPEDSAGSAVDEAALRSPDHIRPDLQRALERIALTDDAARPEAVARRHAQGGRTARENIADLCDEGSFIEYGGLAIAAQQRRRSLDDLQRNTPADGMVTGIGAVNSREFGPERSRTAVLAYDYTVLAGTQGWRNHHKKDRLLKLIHDWQLPTVLFAEGGGGRPGDVDMPIVAGLNNHTFSQFAALSGQVPFVGIVHGRCFAGNAALLGCADTIIATRSANIGMGGPAMIEGGGLGVYKPEEIGPAADLARNGVIDLLVDDEAAAVLATQQYLGYFQGRLGADLWRYGDARALRHCVPENRLRAYDMRALVGTLADAGSVLELRAGFGHGMVTALIRIEGRPMALLANNPQHLGGAIDPEAADKGARFLQLANAHGLPVLTLCDTPGFMVGPEIERQAQVRHACRLFVAAAHLTVPCFTVVVRKGYGLGAQAMAVGGFDAPVFTVAWPTGEFGAMGLEGAVRLGFRKELEAAAAGPERDALYDRLVAQQYANGSALNMAQTLEIDAVIDPADTRAWLVRGLDSATGRGAAPASGPRFIDCW
ncbi:acetyl-CoA carboxylase family protein [Aquabacterium sp. OR-4]|uniref:acetyl-CoA carboxylase family protein n=1 Tax=Aquabacterium sp. OR-4 TaxID=2978127 RepID=UPI0021B2532F|nr:carboxyl transferase domain-containing protein [Aquabacterium sp. OR-4]MDT7837388.1 carboxyl transferase domain-containing protein [Aquabacterium sp. OR-4]